VAEAVINGTLQAFEAAAGFVGVTSEEPAQLHVLHAVGFSSGRLSPGATIPLELGRPLSDAIRTRTVLFIETGAERRERYPQWTGPSETSEAGALACVPLLLPDRVLGGILISFAGARPFEPDDREFALTVAQQCAQALERASLYSELELRVEARTADMHIANEQLAAANTQLVSEIAERREAQRQVERSREEERARVARELHDELGSMLTGLKMSVSRVLKDAELPGDAETRLREAAVTIDTAVEAVRRLATELRPQILDDFGLVPALEAHFQDFLRRTGLTGRFECQFDKLDLTSEAATACYRIFQEALTNVARHAQASEVVVRLEPAGSDLLLGITDNGRGMALEDRAARGHFGLVGMQERANLLAAPLDIISAPGRGTTILVRIPTAPPGQPD
jgi:signal transduction histidine kinase